MTDRIQQIVEALPEEADPVALAGLLDRLRGLYDVDNAIYYALSLGGDRAGEEFGAMTYAPEWHQRYEEVNYRELDPVVQAAGHGFAPVEWRTLDWTGRPIRRFLAEAHEYRVGNHGLTVPIHGPQGQLAMFTISKACTDSEWATLIPEISQDVLLLSHYIHRQVMETTGAEAAAGPTQKLSPRERDVLTMISAGRRRAQIADALGISESTLRVYIDSARHKLGALNTFHAVALAMKTGAIKV
ncbi:helix-turn-helix transcriptional regulator [Rhodovulum sp. DZ06]|uniref:helix-turn-helix transcriptional regulator n=1 Tax=Rhodovulum sp. DZ06 TaxID=3425126 RepID=UPI003D32E3E0